MDYAKNLSAAVAALFLAACADEIPCLATGAVKTENGCVCPEGTRLEEDLKAQTSVCVEDAGVDISPSGAEDSGSSKQDAGSIDAAAEDGAAEQLDAERLDADRDGDTAPEDEADAMTSPPEEMPACEPTPEECDGRDNDCDGETDEEVSTRCWVDGDGDGFAARDAKATESCDECGPKQTSEEPVAGKVDCDDADLMMRPGATDVCGDGVDNDCDGKVDEEMNNACGGACTAALPGKPGDSCSNGLEGACTRDGVYECRPDHTLACTAERVTPAATDTCGDGSDNDCDGTVDDGCVMNECRGWSRLPGKVGDGCTASAPGECAKGKLACSGPDAVACAAGSPTGEVCGDGKDNNCDGSVDDGCDPPAECGNGKVEPGEECDPAARGWSDWTCSSDCKRQRHYAKCVVDADCVADGNRCVEGRCTRSCTTDSDCPATVGPTKAFCSLSGSVCWVIDCAVASQCPEGQLCEIHTSITFGALMACQVSY